MKVLMITRSNAFTSHGGDTTQILMTAEYLQRIGVTVDVKPVQDVASTDSYDLLHFFNIIRPDDILPFIKSKKPYCVSTVFVEYIEYEKNRRQGVAGLLFKMLTSGQIEYAKALARWIVNGDRIKSNYYFFNGHKKSVRKIAEHAGLLLPNSHHESQRISTYLNQVFPYRKIVNAVNLNVFNEKVVPDENYRNHVICVGRIEGLKNQLNLIKAILDTDYYLSIIGKPSPNHISYYQECVDLARNSARIQFIEHTNHNELARIYKAAKVHVLPSWFETTGLSSLEAAVMDCNIVITDKGDTVEYFGDLAYYCEPQDVHSIKNAIQKAFENPVNPSLKKLILENYTWEKTAQQTKEAYSALLNVSEIKL